MSFRIVGWPDIRKIWKREKMYIGFYSENLTRKTLEDMGINGIVTSK
jgi:hypothetical protein